MNNYYTAKMLRAELAENLTGDAGNIGIIPSELSQDADLIERPLTYLRAGEANAPQIVQIQISGGEVIAYGLRRESGLSLHASPQAAMDWTGGDMRPWHGVPIPGLVLRDALELRGNASRGKRWRESSDEDRSRIIEPYDALVKAAAQLTLAVADEDTESWILATQVLA